MVEKLGQIGALWPIFAKNSIFHNFTLPLSLGRFSAPGWYLVCEYYIHKHFKLYETHPGADKRPLVRKKTLHFSLGVSEVDLRQKLKSCWQWKAVTEWFVLICWNTHSACLVKLRFTKDSKKLSRFWKLLIKFIQLVSKTWIVSWL